jgi:hypothetical protein
MSRLNGRVSRLEQRFGPLHLVGSCRACGHEHAPLELTIALVRSIIGPISDPPRPGWPPRRTEPFCACGCCGENGRTLADFMRGR